MTAQAAARHADDWKPELFEIPVERILPGANVRSPQALDVQELAASIKAQGVLSPIRVEEAGVGEDGTVRYALVYGQRRLAAAKVAGLTTIPAIVDAHNRTGADLVVTQLVENLQRTDLNPLEEARAYRQLLDAGLSQKAIAERLGRAPSTIAHALRLLKLAEPIRAQIAAGELSASHAKAIATLPDAEQAELGRRIVEHNLSAHDVEEEVSLAQGRAAQEERIAEERTSATARRLQTFTEMLAKKKLDPSKVTLAYAFAGTVKDVLDQLAAAGWTVKQAQQLTTPAKDICDCTAWRFEIRYEWPAGEEVEKVSLAKCCISKKHQEAASKAARDAFEAQQAEQREKERQAAEEKAATLAPLAAAVTPALPPEKAKLVLFAMVGGDQSNGYWNANRWAERQLRYDGWRELLWERIDALPHERLLAEIGKLVAEAVVDAGGKVRAAAEGLTTAHERVQLAKASAK